MSSVNVRHMVNDVNAAVAFYTKHVGFALLSQAGQAFAAVGQGDLRLLLSGRSSSAGGRCRMDASQTLGVGIGFSSCSVPRAAGRTSLQIAVAASPGRSRLHSHDASAATGCAALARISDRPHRS